jgi:hypothetical protein
MRGFNRLLFVMLAGLPLAACGMQDPNVSPPRLMPDGTVHYPPPGGWPGYAPGGESGGSGGRS